MKFALVLITLTRTVLLASVRARVKSPHMMALKSKFIPKKNCQLISLAQSREWSLCSLDLLLKNMCTYTSYDDLNDHALIFHAKEMRESCRPRCCEVSCC
jgi:hypothetical protein